MHELFKIRKEYGGVYVTVFNNGLMIPWKPLALGDYIQYSQDRDRGLIPHVQLEDEIFTKCVQDDSIIKDIKFIRAGIVTTVVANIWQFSGPTSANEFNDDLEAARQILLSPTVRALHELVQIISIAFPYKPEEIYKMSYDKFLFRLAQSEKKLLELGLFLKEPITLRIQEEEKKQNKLGKIKQSEKPIIDAKQLWDKQQEAPSKKQPHLPINEVKTDKKWWNKSPVLEAATGHDIDFKTESAEQYFSGSTGHEKMDSHLDRSKLVEDSKWIYADLLKELANRKKK